MTTDTAGLSKNEREFIQDLGEVGRLNDSFRVYKHRIKHKIHPTLTDAILILKYAYNVELLDYLKNDCKEDLLTLHDLVTELLTKPVTENGNPSKEPLST